MDLANSCYNNSYHSGYDGDCILCCRRFSSYIIDLAFHTWVVWSLAKLLAFRLKLLNRLWSLTFHYSFTSAYDILEENSYKRRDHDMEKVITVAGLKKFYGPVEAVKNIDFYVSRGSLFAFLGPNGAGKTTTINILGTLLKPDEGEVIIGGYTLGREDDKIRSIIGMVFQDHLLDDELTVRENMTIRGSFYHSDKKKLRAAVDYAAQITGVTAYQNRHYGELSGGQKRRSDIARALVNTPKILFLDEPTTGLDPQTRQNVWKL